MNSFPAIIHVFLVGSDSGERHAATDPIHGCLTTFCPAFRLLAPTERTMTNTGSQQAVKHGIFGVHPANSHIQFLPATDDEASQKSRRL
jgi:hypothetical protein